MNCKKSLITAVLRTIELPESGTTTYCEFARPGQRTMLRLLRGATGVTGRSLILQLEKSGLWSGIYGSSRRPLNFGQQVRDHLLKECTEVHVIT